jgi:hypothetical protein
MYITFKNKCMVSKKSTISILPTKSQGFRRCHEITGCRTVKIYSVSIFLRFCDRLSQIGPPKWRQRCVKGLMQEQKAKQKGRVAVAVEKKAIAICADTRDDCARVRRDHVQNGVRMHLTSTWHLSGESCSMQKYSYIWVIQGHLGEGHFFRVHSRNVCVQGLWRGQPLVKVQFIVKVLWALHEHFDFYSYAG